MKPQRVKLRFRGHWFLFPFVNGIEDTGALMFSGEDNARLLTRLEAAGVLRKWRTAGRYYRMEVVK